MWAALFAALGKALLPLAEKAGEAALPIIWQQLVKVGVITQTEVSLLNAGSHVLQVVQSIKVDPTYPVENNNGGVSRGNGG